jgi:predicted amino acid racemase
MFLAMTEKRNPGLIEAGAELLRSGRIPPNTYVIDLDSVQHNARLIATAAAKHDLVAYQMTKQFGRNPLVARAVADAGVTSAVAVDWTEAQTLAAAGISIGHLGHLVQTPQSSLDAAVQLRPEFVTVFGVDQARRWSAAATAAGVVQQVLVRVTADGDFIFPTQRGGVDLADVEREVTTIASLPGLSFAGVTSFPCLRWEEEHHEFRPTPNLRTLITARDRIQSTGLRSTVINAPSANCVATLPLLADLGATHVEPGSALTGHVPSHAAVEHAEVPACVYVTEVTHQSSGSVFTLGGGFYARSHARHALVFSTTRTHRAMVEPPPPGEIDYYGELIVDDPTDISVGDPAVYAFRSQIFVTRASVAVVTDLDSSPHVLGVFDSSGHPL